MVGSMGECLQAYGVANCYQQRECLANAGKHPKFIIGAMMRKLMHIAFGVFKSDKSFDPALPGC